LPGLDLVRVHLVALRQIAHCRLLPQRLQRDLRLQRRVNLPSRLQLSLLDLPTFRAPAPGQFISLPDGGQPALNRLHLRVGRLPEPGRTDEVVVNDSFAEAHGFTPGARFSAILNGRKRELMVVGTALSPEFIYARRPGDIMPDDRRFGIVWMPEKALASAYDLDGAFSSVTLKLLPGTS